MRRVRGLACVAAVLLTGAGAQSALAATCTISSSGISFGRYDPLAAIDTPGAGSIYLVCDVPVPATIAIGHGGGDLPGTRAMRGGGGGGRGGELPYDLYIDSQRSAVWGDGTGGSTTVTVQGTVIDRPIYGAIPAGRRMTAGSYADALTLTVSY